jgi:hypothetical protein
MAAPVGGVGKPTTGKPTTGKPTTGKPTTGKPTTGKPTTGKPTTGKPITGKHGKYAYPADIYTPAHLHDLLMRKEFAQLATNAVPRAPPPRVNPNFLDAAFLREQNLVLHPNQQVVRNLLDPHTTQTRVLVNQGTGHGKTIVATSAAMQHVKLYQQIYNLQYYDPNGQRQATTPSVFIIGFSRAAFLRELLRRPEFGFVTRPELDELARLRRLAETGHQHDVEVLREFEHRIRRRLSQRKRNGFFRFYGYKEFYNKLFQFVEEPHRKLDEAGFLEALKAGTVRLNLTLLDTMRNSLVICDEIHNVYNSAEINNYGMALRFALNIFDVPHLLRPYVTMSDERFESYRTGTLRLIFMSATIINNSPTEVIDLLNLLVATSRILALGYGISARGDVGVPRLERSDFFLDHRQLRPGALERIGELTRGLVSFLRDLNPAYYPERHMDGEPLPHVVGTQRDTPYLRFIRCPMTPLHLSAYRSLDGGAIPPDGHALADMAMPNPEGPHAPGLFRTKDFRYVIATAPEKWREAQGIEVSGSDIHGSILDEDRLARLVSGKYTQMLRDVDRVLTTGVGKIFVSHQLVHGSGVLMVAEILRRSGILDETSSPSPRTRCTHCGVRLEVHPDPTTGTKASRLEAHTFAPARFVLIYAELDRSSIERSLDRFRHPDNLRGYQYRFIIGSSMMNESVDLNAVAEIWNLTHPDNVPTLLQIIGRAIRKGSHQSLPPEARHVHVRIYVSSIPRGSELRPKSGGDDDTMCNVDGGADVGVNVDGSAEDDTVNSGVDVNVYGSAEDDTVNVNVYGSAEDDTVNVNVDGSTEDTQPTNAVENWLAQMGDNLFESCTITMEGGGPTRRIIQHSTRRTTGDTKKTPQSKTSSKASSKTSSKREPSQTELTQEELRYHEKSLDYLVIQQIERVFNEQAFDAPIEYDTIFPPGRIPRKPELGTLYYEPAAYLQRIIGQYHQPGAKIQLQMATHHAYYSEEELVRCLYIIRRAFAEQSPAFTYAELWELAQNPPFEIQVRADLLDEGTFRLALQKIVRAGEGLITPASHVVESSRYFDPQDPYILIRGREHRVVYTHSGLYVCLPVQRGIAPMEHPALGLSQRSLYGAPDTDTDAWYRSEAAMSGMPMRLGITGFLRNSHPNYSEMKYRFFHQYGNLPVDQLPTTTEMYDLNFHRQFMEDAIRYAYLLLTDEDHTMSELHDFYFRMLYLYDRLELLLFAEDMRDTDQWPHYAPYVTEVGEHLDVPGMSKADARLLAEGRKFNPFLMSSLVKVDRSFHLDRLQNFLGDRAVQRTARNREDRLGRFYAAVKRQRDRTVRRVYAHMLPVGHLLQVADGRARPRLLDPTTLEFTDHPELGRAYEMPQRENPLIIGYYERISSNLEVKFQLRDPVQNMERHKDARLQRTGSACSTRKKEELEEICRMLRIPVSHGSIRDMCNAIKATLMRRDLEELRRVHHLPAADRARHPRIRWFYLHFEVQPI